MKLRTDRWALALFAAGVLACAAPAPETARPAGGPTAGANPAAEPAAGANPSQDPAGGADPSGDVGRTGDLGPAADLASAGVPLADRIPAAWPYPVDVRLAGAPQGMVTTNAPLATQVGVEVLEAGGNAIDAAVATAFALAVVYPEAGNLGGGGFMVVHTAAGEAASLDFRETAPLAATRDMFLNEEGEVTDQSTIGHLASGVPGSVAGLWEAHQRFGTLPWADLVEPAIRLAEDGFTVNERFEASVRGEQDRLARFPASAELFLPEGEPLEAGTTWRNPDLAAVLRRIAEEGTAGFYEGETADLIVAEMQRGGGLITHEDLSRYEAKWRRPIVFDYRGYRVISMPPPSSGGITLALIANILEGYDLGELGWHSPEAMHLTTEAMRRAFADRNYYLGDPDFVEIPRERLLSEQYAARRRASIALDQATPSAAVSPGLGTDGSESTHTTHVSVVDAMGNAVALTTTVNFLYGSAVTVAGAGFVLNDEMDDFAAKPGTPNAYGLVQGEINAIEPGKRMLSAMTPAIVLEPVSDGGDALAAGAPDTLAGAFDAVAGRPLSSYRPLLVTGARGGPRIITAVFQVLSNVVDYGMDLATAVNTPRIHHQHLPDILYYEPHGLTEGQIGALRALGHRVEARSGTIGNAPSIMWNGEQWVGTPDPRSGGLAAGY